MAKWYEVTTSEEPTEEEAKQRERLEDAWPDAPIENLELCAFLLSIAREDVIAYAPAPAPVPAGEPVPDPPARYVLAQLQQAKNLWNAGTVNSDGEFGGEGYSYTPRPLDKTIKKLIRPVAGRPHVL